MTNEIDQRVCREILDRRVRRHADELVAGDVVSVEIGGESIEAEVEVRHLNAIDLFERRYPGPFHEGVTFRIEPKDEVKAEPEVKDEGKGERKKRGGGRKPKPAVEAPAAPTPDTPAEPEPEPEAQSAETEQ